MRERNEPMIIFDNVSMEYCSTAGETTSVFQSLSLSVSPGEFFCVLGPSGCGKTTLLNMIAGFLKPSAGRVSVAGQTVQGPGADRGCVFQEYSLFPWLTVEQNIEFGLRSRGTKAEIRRSLVEEHLQMVGLSETRTKYPFELSGGMQQRVGIARALINRPSVLLMDEPFAALDAITRTAMQVELLNIWRQAKATIFYITHNIEEAVFLGTRVAVMSSRPGGIAHVLEVGLEYPRARTETRFNEIYKELETALYTHIDPAMLRAA
jgi:NitT/TauT family transport system ATP-binding protein